MIECKKHHYYSYNCLDCFAEQTGADQIIRSPKEHKYVDLVFTDPETGELFTLPCFISNDGIWAFAAEYYTDAATQTGMYDYD